MIFMSRFLQMVVAGVALACLAGAQQPRRKSAPPARLGIERLNRMPKQERDRLLEKLPPERRQAMERRLERLDRMSPAAKQRLSTEFDQFQQLSPDHQARVRQLYRSFSDLPEDRRGPVRRAYQQLRQLPPEARERRLSSERFRSRFDDGERHLLEELSGLMSAPSSVPSPPPSDR